MFHGHNERYLDMEKKKKNVSPSQAWIGTIPLPLILRVVYNFRTHRCYEGEAAWAWFQVAQTLWVCPFSSFFSHGMGFNIRRQFINFEMLNSECDHWPDIVSYSVHIYSECLRSPTVSCLDAGSITSYCHSSREHVFLLFLPEMYPNIDVSLNFSLLNGITRFLSSN